MELFMNRLPLRLAKFFVVFLFSSATPLAFSDSNFYLDLSGGYLFSLHNSTVTDNSNQLSLAPDGINVGLFQLQDVTWKNHYRDGFEGGLTFGVKFENWRWDAEFLYQNVERDIDGSFHLVQLDADGGDEFAPAYDTTDSQTRLSLYSFLFNVYYDFQINHKWNPFIGAGVGAAIVNSESTSENLQLPVTDTTGNTASTVNFIAKSPTIKGVPFAWQLKGGLAYNVDEHFSVVGQYRLFGTTSLSSGSSTVIANPYTAAPTTFYVEGQEVKGLLLNGFDLALRYIF
jgi:opacity protein-like surface antigen